MDPFISQNTKVQWTLIRRNAFLILDYRGEFEIEIISFPIPVSKELKKEYVETTIEKRKNQIIEEAKKYGGRLVRNPVLNDDNIFKRHKKDNSKVTVLFSLIFENEENMNSFMEDEKKKRWIVGVENTYNFPLQKCF